jgi:hypothetical protein
MRIFLSIIEVTKPAWIEHAELSQLKNLLGYFGTITSNAPQRLH